MELAIHLRPADQYQEYLDDRMDIGEPTPATLLGGEAQTWSYSQDDHTAIAAVSEGFTPEVRGSFMDKETYLTLVEQLIWVDQANFEAAMPEEFVTDAERETVIAEMLADVPVPEGFEASSEQSDRYALGAEVTGAVACHWLRQYADLYGSGDEGPKQEAVDALGTSRDWAILQEMDEQGDWPETIWEYADQIARGERPENVNAALGCSELG